MAQLEGAFSEVEISQAYSFGLDVLVRPVRTFPSYHCVGINMLGDAWRDLLNPRLRGLEQYQ
jgi:hypothetical protein